MLFFNDYIYIKNQNIIILIDFILVKAIIIPFEMFKCCLKFLKDKRF